MWMSSFRKRMSWNVVVFTLQENELECGMWMSSFQREWVGMWNVVVFTLQDNELECGMWMSSLCRNVSSSRR